MSRLVLDCLPCRLQVYEPAVSVAAHPRTSVGARNIEGARLMAGFPDHTREHGGPISRPAAYEIYPLSNAKGKPLIRLYKYIHAGR